MSIERARKEIELLRARCMKQLGEQADTYDVYMQNLALDQAMEAYQAVETVLESQGHSGFSYGYVTRIVKNLIDGNILTPIEEYDEYSDILDIHIEGETSYQNKRLPSFFKHVKDDGSVYYVDVERVVCTDPDHSSSWSNGFIRSLVDEMYPISLPYMPPTRPYVVVVDDYLIYDDPKKSEFDTMWVRGITEPDGKIVPVDRIFTCPYDSDTWKEISAEEFREAYENHRNTYSSDVEGEISNDSKDNGES